MVKKLKEIRETASDAAEIMRALGDPEVMKSFKEIKEIANMIKDIVDSLKEPAMVRNIENIRLTVESAQYTASKMENSVLKIKDTGIIEEARKTLKTTREVIGVFGQSPQSTETVEALRDMILSIKELVNELNLLAIKSNKSGLIRDVKEAVQEGSNLYKNIKE